MSKEFPSVPPPAAEQPVRVSPEALEVAKLKAGMKVFVDRFASDSLMRVSVSLREEQEQAGDGWSADRSSVLAAHASAPKSETAEFKDPVVAFAARSFAESSMAIKALEEAIREEEDERLACFMDIHPDDPNPLRECGPEVAEFEEMIPAFEATYSLADLLSITQLSKEERTSHPIRRPAQIALELLVDKLRVLRTETNISDEKSQELEGKYRHILRAVGMVVDATGEVDHTRG